MSTALVRLKDTPAVVARNTLIGWEVRWVMERTWRWLIESGYYDG